MTLDVIQLTAPCVQQGDSERCPCTVFQTIEKNIVLRKTRVSVPSRRAGLKGRRWELPEDSLQASMSLSIFNWLSLDYA